MLDARTEKAVAAGMGAVSQRPLVASSVEDACRSAIEAYRKAGPVQRFELPPVELIRDALVVGRLSFSDRKELADAVIRDLAEWLDQRPATEQPTKAEVELPTREEIADTLRAVPTYYEMADYVLSLLRQHSRADQAEEPICESTLKWLAEALDRANRLEAERDDAIESQKLAYELAAKANAKYALEIAMTRAAEAEVAKLRAEHARLREACELSKRELECHDFLAREYAGARGYGELTTILTVIVRIQSALKQDAEPKPEKAFRVECTMDANGEPRYRVPEAPQHDIAKLAADVEAMKESLETSWEHIERLGAAVRELIGGLGNSVQSSALAYSPMHHASLALAKLEGKFCSGSGGSGMDDTTSRLDPGRHERER